MSGQSSAPSSATITSAVLQHALSLYPTVLEAFYNTKVKGDKQKHAQAHEDDKWRYDELPSQLKQLSSGQGISKEDLERLVRWKITHQTNRPFLLPQIRKNDDNTVRTQTARARDTTLRPDFPLGGLSEKSSSKGPPGLRTALEQATALNGVGPATATLILAVFHEDVPFFEDELFAWLLPNFGGKLRYNMQEYFDMYHALQGLKAKLEKTNMHSHTAAAFEKVAFVCQHWDHVAENDKDQMQTLMSETDENAPTMAEESNDTAEQEPPVSRQQSKRSVAQADKEVATQQVKQPGSQKRTAKSENKASVPRRSKRAKK